MAFSNLSECNLAARAPLGAQSPCLPWQVTLVFPMLLTCTEHVVSDFNFSGCLAGILVYNGHIELLQNCGKGAWASGPCFFQVSPTCYPPFVTCQHQPVEGSMRIIKCIVTTFSCLALLLQIALIRHLFLTSFGGPNQAFVACIFRTVGQSPHLCTTSLVGRQTGWM